MLLLMQFTHDLYFFNKSSTTGDGCKMPSPVMSGHRILCVMHSLFVKTYGNSTSMLMSNRSTMLTSADFFGTC